MNTGPARGMRDFLPEEVRRRQYVMGVVAEVYERYGFEPLETPAVENIETLLGKYGDEGDRLIFKILKRGEGAESGQADLALRYDLTVPLARVVAEYGAKLPKFFKRYQIQPVWRADRPQKGRFREFYQCDVDAIGSTAPVIEAELCAACSDVLLKLGFSSFAIVINHRVLLAALLNGAGIAADLHGDAIVAVDKIDKIGREGVAAELGARGIAVEPAERLLEWLGAGTSAGWLDWLDAQPWLDAEGRAAVENLRQIVRLCQETSAGPFIRIEPSLARGLSYYTGAIFEITVPDLAGSLGGGGRYDNLVGMFSREQVPAAGFSLGLERILVVMAERGMFPASLPTTPADVMVVQWFANRTGYYLQFAAALRRAGLRVEVYPDPPDQDGKKVFEKQIKYASTRGVPFVAIIGESELASSTESALASSMATVKNMKTGQQTTIPVGDVAPLIQRTLKTGS